MLKKGIAVKMIQFLLVSVMLVAPAMAQNPNAELDAWKAAFAESQRITAENASNYAADRAEWRAAMAEANRPMTKKEKFVKVALYVGDKFVDHVNFRTATRAELGRAGIPGLPTQFAMVNGNVDRTANEMAKLIGRSEQNLLNGQYNTQQLIVAAANFNAAVTNQSAATTQRTVIDAALFNADVTRDSAAVTQRAVKAAAGRVLRQMRQDNLPNCQTPFGTLSGNCKQK